MTTESYAVIEDEALLDKEKLWPFISLDAKEKAFRAWAKTTGHNVQMLGAKVGRELPHSRAQESESDEIGLRPGHDLVQPHEHAVSRRALDCEMSRRDLAQRDHAVAATLPGLDHEPIGVAGVAGGAERNVDVHVLLGGGPPEEVEHGLRRAGRGRCRRGGRRERFEEGQGNGGPQALERGPAGDRLFHDRQAPQRE